MDLLRYRYRQIDFIDEPVGLGFDCPWTFIGFGNHRLGRWRYPVKKL